MPQRSQPSRISPSLERGLMLSLFVPVMEGLKLRNCVYRNAERSAMKLHPRALMWYRWQRLSCALWIWLDRDMWMYGTYMLRQMRKVKSPGL
ncbi:hypothetical protein DPMN_173551 [Dreissena polymorpha]|uniref:Uncharacterized protein n=1 Tax=Dreissena polymorpha TaxID=45954 RepID=A0A9D4E3N2_DREPO|nr:hypothetical protein DPMN_173551 [Dreissena polymorpha]